MKLTAFRLAGLGTAKEARALAGSIVCRMAQVQQNQGIGEIPDGFRVAIAYRNQFFREFKFTPFQ